MTELLWTSKTLADLARLHEFLTAVNGPAANRAVQTLVRAPLILRTSPRLGEQLFQSQPREVRRLLVDDYEVRYEIRKSAVYVLRVWHTREKR